MAIQNFSPLQLNSTLTVGVDDTGHDVKFYGATSDRYLWWDESEDALKLRDNTTLKIGSGSDLQIKHDGSNSYISQNDGGNLYIQQNVNDADLVLQCDDGSNGTTAYITLDGSAGYTTVQKNMVFADSVSSRFGTGGDLAIFHDGSQGYISLEGTGDLYIRNTTDDKDIIFQSDDGSGGTTAYLTLDGSAKLITTHVNNYYPDNISAFFGAGGDLRILHDGSHSTIQNNTGNLTISTRAADTDIVFQSDDGSGGETTYLTLDGGVGHSIASKAIRFNDSVEAFFGNGDDLKVIHNGSHSYVSHVGTGDLYLQNTTDDGNVILRSDNGSGGVTPYLTLDGSAGTVEVAKPMNLATPLATDQQKHLACFDFKGYGTSDGTNYEMMEAMSDNNAPFEHNTSTGSDGLNAQTVNIAIRSGGHVMPHTGTIKKFSGWASSAGIGNVDIGIFRFRPVDNNNGNLTPVLMVNERISSYGNAIMKVFSETESFDADFEAGDIVFSAVKGGNSSPKTWYFTSILEVEWS